MIACHVVPVLRAIRRVAVARPRIAAPAAVAGSVVRRAPRVMLVCRDVGALGGAAALAGSGASVAPAIAPGVVPGAPPPPAPATGGPAASPGGEGGGIPFAGPPLGSPPGVPPGPGHPPFLPPGLLFPPGVPPSGDGPRDDWTAVVVRVPEVPPPLGVPEPSALALFAVALMVAAILGRRARRA